MAGPAPRQVKAPAPGFRPEIATPAARSNSVFAVSRAAGNNALNILQKQEAEQLREGAGDETDFERLSPEDRARLSTPLRQRANAAPPRIDPRDERSAAENESSLVQTVIEGAGDVGSWAVGQGEVNAWQDSNAKPVGAQLADEASAPQRDFRKIAEKLDAEDMPDRVALGFMQSPLASNTWLDLIAKSADGRYLLSRLYVRLVEGTTGPIEGFVRGLIPLPLADRTNTIMKQATRLIDTLTRAVPLETFDKAVGDKKHLKIFPFKLQGLTTFSQTPLDVKLSPEGKVTIELWTQLPGQYPDEYKTLPPEICTQRVTLEPAEIVGIRLYDQGGLCIFRPAIYLLHLDQQYTQDTAATVQLSAGLGAAVGGGSAAGGLTGAAKVLGYIDNAVLVLGLLTKLVNEHRWWLEDQGLGGFLLELDAVNSVAQIYGLARLVSSAPQMLRGVHESYANWRERKSFTAESISIEQQAVLKGIDDNLKNIPNPPDREDLKSPLPAQKADQPTPTVIRDQTDSLSPLARKQLELHAATGGKPIFASPDLARRPTPPEVPQAHVIDSLATKGGSQPPPTAQAELTLRAPESTGGRADAPRTPSEPRAEFNAGSKSATTPRAPTERVAGESTPATPTGYEKYQQVESNLVALDAEINSLSRKVAEDRASLRALESQRIERRNELKRHAASDRATLETLQSKADEIEKSAGKIEKRLQANDRDLNRLKQQADALRPFQRLAPPKPGETPEQLANRWFEQMRNETLSEYARRIKTAENDVLAIVTAPGQTKEWNLLHERWEAALRLTRAREAGLQRALSDRAKAMKALHDVEQQASKAVTGSAVFEKLKQARLSASVAQERVNGLEYGLTTGQFAEHAVVDTLPSEFENPRAAQKAGGQGVDLLADETIASAPQTPALAVLEVKGTAGSSAGSLSTAQQNEKYYVVDRLLDSANNGSRASEEALAKLQANEYQDIRFYKADVTNINLKTGDRNVKSLRSRGSMSVGEFKKLAQEWHALGQQRFKLKYGLVE
jgi:hypothetical protein